MEENRQNEKLENAFDPVELEVNGFHFLTKSDADKARVDAGKIEYIQSHVAYTTASSLLAVYEKAITNKIFGTPVGWNFLQDLRKQLMEMGVAEQELSPIPMTASFTRPLAAQATDTQSVALAVSNQKIEKEKKPPALILSIAMNVILIFMVIFMFIILFVGETDNMVNYKRNINNRYASWEEELKMREQLIKQKEKELGIQYN